MALAEVTGTLADFGGNFDPDIGLRIVFRPNGAAVSAGGIIYSKPVIVDTFTPDGAQYRWTALLESTDAAWLVTGDDVFYIVTIERLETDGDYFPVDHTGWQLKVPPSGGTFSALVRAPTNPAQMWVGPARASAQGAPGWDQPVQTLLPTAFTSWYKTNALPGEPNYFEWT